MGFRADKLARIARSEGWPAAGRFLLRDLYYRALHRLAFPGWRRRTDLATPREFATFVEEMNRRGSARVLEIGSRAVSDTTRRDQLGPPIEYVGLDILPGPNVDLVGDAHELSSLLAPESFDGVFSYSVFEHLLMPWKVVLEINRVLKPGGLVFVGTHPTWPPHELPWDFWRFQPNGFWALFNPATGFEILSCSTFEPARLIPAGTGSHLGGTVKQECHLGIVLIARKTADHDPRLSWPVSVTSITDSSYPERRPAG
jgi:SAM-dependent methyltransferase